jgi:uncharacterized membrane protein (UPF0127 family)
MILVPILLVGLALLSPSLLTYALPTAKFRAAFSPATNVASNATERILIGGVVLTVELALTGPEQQRGLSGRTSLSSNQGMLFVFVYQDYWSFWMYDMKFPLDIIWFDSSRRAVYLEPNLPLCTQLNCPVITPDLQARYVLEVNAGFAAAHNITLGKTFVVLGP